MKDIDFMDNIVKRNRIPILIYTPEWIQLFSNFRSKALNKIVAALEELLSNERELEDELKQLEKRKKVVMNKILYISNDINDKNNQAAIPKMEEAQRELLDINERMPIIIEELETLPDLINQQNTVLLKETIKRAYELIKENKTEAEKCQQEIVEIRKKLGTLIQKKVEHDEKVNKLYSFVHGMIGAAEMEKLDKSFFE